MDKPGPREISRRNRTIGITVSLVAMPEEDPSCRWQTQCDHGRCVGHASLKVARSFLGVPWEWCPACQALAEMAKRKTSTPTYLEAVQWIVFNDSAGDSDALEVDSVQHLVTVVLIADLFGVETETLAGDIVALRSATNDGESR